MNMKKNEQEKKSRTRQAKIKECYRLYIRNLKSQIEGNNELIEYYKAYIKILLRKDEQLKVLLNKAVKSFAPKNTMKAQ
jgi:hypothetical protein